MLAHDLGAEYSAVRAATRGRAKGTESEGKCLLFYSARKMMSWAVPLARDPRALIGGPLPLGFGLGGCLLMARRWRVCV